MTARRALRLTLAAGLGLALLLTIFLDIATLVVPIYDMQLYDRVLQSQNMDTLAMLSLACAVGLLLFGLLDYLRGACFVTIGEAVGRHLNGVVLREGVRRGAADGDQSGVDLIRDLHAVQTFLASGAVAVPMDALCAPMFLIVLFMLHPVFGYLSIAGVTLVTLIGLTAEILVRPGLLEAQEQRTRAAQSLGRNLTDPELTDGLGMLPAISRVWTARYGRARANLDRANERALILAGLSRVVRLGLQASGITLGALLVLAGATTPGSLMGANLLLNKLPALFDHLVGSWRQWAIALAAWRRIDQMLGAPVQPPHEAVPGESRPGLSVENIQYRTASGQILLRDVSFHVMPGTLVAVTGPNGAGKSTLLRLLAGLAPPAEGRISLDGVPVYGGPGTGYLPQSVALLEGTIADNIGQFKTDAFETTIAAARLAGVHETIGRMARGYDTLLTRNGSELSGGMRQRIGLARALHGSPGLLVLDEPDASLDAEGSSALLRALRARRDAGAIVIVTSHRPALRDAADRIVTLRDGAIADPESPAPALTRPVPSHLAIA